MPSFKWIEQKQLVERIKNGDATTVIIDVRDIDFEGGNIKSATNIPYFDEAKAMSLLHHIQLHQITTVVFHCFYCRMRGPTAAKLFQKIVSQQNHSNSQPIEIVVLRGGWSKWKNAFKTNSELVENVVLPKQE